MGAFWSGLKSWFAGTVLPKVEERAVDALPGIKATLMSRVRSFLARKFGG